MCQILASCKLLQAPAATAGMLQKDPQMQALVQLWSAQKQDNPCLLHWEKATYGLVVNAAYQAKIQEMYRKSVACRVPCLLWCQHCSIRQPLACCCSLPRWISPHSISRIGFSSLIFYNAKSTHGGFPDSAAALSKSPGQSPLQSMDAAYRAVRGRSPLCQSFSHPRPSPLELHTIKGCRRTPSTILR